MEEQRVRVGSFNLFNLARAGTPFYGRLVYTPEDFEAKASWVAGQLEAMGADVCGFQEVFHEDALAAVLARTRVLAEATLLVAGEERPTPRVALATSLPVRAHEVIEDFPAASRVELGEGVLAPARFSRPVLRAEVLLPGDVPAEVWVVHLKSKRPEVPEGRDPHDPLERTKGKLRSLLIRACEATALRALLLERMAGTTRPTILVGDLNDSRDAMTTELLADTPPWRSLPREVKEQLWDVLLYEAAEARGPGRDRRDVAYSHIHNGVHQVLDQVFVSQEFVRMNRRHVGAVETVRWFNDHLVDGTWSREPPPPHTSDHGQVVVTLRMRGPHRS